MNGAVLLALIPIVILISLGMILRIRQFLGDSFWPQAERLSYYLLLPCLFFDGLATANLQSLPVRELALTLIVSTIVVAGLVMVVRPLMKIDGPAFTSVFQGSVRFNNYVGITLAGGLFGAKGIALAAICNAAIVPTVNILCVLVFSRHGSAKLSGYGILKQLLGNPLVVASFGGIAFQSFGLAIPVGIEPAIRSLGSASLPIGLLCVGAALNFGRMRQWIGPVASSSIMKFLAMPAATAFVGMAIGLEGPALTMALLFQILPTASSAYVMARQLGGDAPLMAGIIAAQTVLALATMPLILAVVERFVVI
ncbi:AEC family transporter [Rhizobium sp. ZPR3]|uniref:AEC family transporter n=2 Tax=unclassified Rhizobium TaxID=2613769 RepID=A0AAU7SPK2_9HYPH